MEKSFWRRAVPETLCAALFTTVFSAFALAIVAVFVRAFAPAQSVVTAVNWAVKCVGVFAMTALCVRKERAVFKGAAAGILSAVFTMLLFAAIGGGFFLDAFFLLELVVCGILGGCGALLGAKLHKA